MGLGKDKGSSRINRYEHQVTAIGFDNLEKLAQIAGLRVSALSVEKQIATDIVTANCW